MNRWKRGLWVGVSVCVLALGLALGSTSASGAKAPTPVGGGLYVGDKPLLGVGKEAWDVSGILKLTDGSLLTWGYADPLTKEQQFVKRSTDAGANWQDVAMPGSAKGKGYFRFWREGDRLYAWGESGLWLSRDQGSQWKSVWKGGRKTTSLDVQGRKIAVVTDGVLQVSADEGQHFTKLEAPKETSRAAFDADGTIYAQVMNKVYDLHAGKWNRVNGSFFTKTGGHVITFDPQGVYMWVNDHTVTYEYPTAKRSAERLILLGDRLYLLSEDKLYARSLNPDEPWSTVELPNQGSLIGLEQAPGGDLYYAFGAKLPV
ncbi:WD40/YVTN/BNR-like repeat-containing protein [Tumebacillus permanentifrigoris]|uniref:WD40/YVTN/BNR-like repeat-containing protein n=1 Tax=Tumebacillus permanentifrigoris TaxID=378543 RepID=UPI0011B2028B|nr:hypothetical protein [Tumebacillus permanentifrigoris]